MSDTKKALPLHRNQAIAQMAESVDALVSNTSGATHPGSIPGLGTETEKVEKLSPFSLFNKESFFYKVNVLQRTKLAAIESLCFIGFLFSVEAPYPEIITRQRQCRSQKRSKEIENLGDYSTPCSHMDCTHPAAGLLVN